MNGSDADKESGTVPLAVAFVREFAGHAGRRGLFAAAFVFAGALLEGLGVLIIVPLLGVVVRSGGHDRFQRAAQAVFDSFGAESPFWRLALLLGLFALLMIVRAVVVRVRDVMLSRLQSEFVEANRMRIVEYLAAARWDQIAGLRHARIAHLMSGDVLRIGQAAHFTLQSSIAFVMLLVNSGLALVLSPPLALIAFAMVAVSAVALIPLLRRARALGSFITQANLSLLNSTSQFLGGLKLAISQNLQESFVAEFRVTLRELTERSVANVRRQTNSRIALSTLSALVSAALVLIGFGAFHLSAPLLITMLLIVGRMNGPVAQIQQGTQQLAFALPAYEKVKELEAEMVGLPHPRRGDGTVLTFPEGPIVFEDVSFLHVAPDGEGEPPRGVQHLSLTIRPGEFLGIAGPSGAGKTTFADLLTALFPPQQGRVTVGGRMLEGPVLDAWRKHLAYVSQDPFLFHDSVRRNLLWARPGASEAEIWAALALAGADDLVRRMAEGLDTMVGERGTLVSGGERQRIALARAILRKPRMLVLDEATSAIDIAGERLILERLRALSPRPTIVIVAHRRESLVLCDRVIEFEAGGPPASMPSSTGA